MKNENKLSTVLDLSKGLGFDLLYKPVIGKSESSQYPFIFRLRSGYRPRRDS